MNELSEKAREAMRAYQRAYRKEWNAKNPEKVAAYQKKWRDKNKDKVREYNRRYWEKRADREFEQLREALGGNNNGC